MITPPTASYRLQLQPSFTLADAAAALPYLAGLGISHLHLSPLLEATPGSTHGYDTVDHTRISEQLGGEGALRALAAAAHEHGLRLIADVVPNHMALPVPERLNTPLWHVLRDGPESAYAHWFDIDWAAHGGRILLPVLGDRLGAVLDQLKVDQDTLRYYDHVFPLRPGTEHLPLAQLLSRQHYRLAWWRLAGTELNYRRFFSINELIALRVEDPEVFRATHGVLLRLREEGCWTASGSTTRTAWPTRAPTCAGWPRPAAAPTRWWRRSSPDTNGCPATGPARAPPATTHCGTSTACSPTGPGCTG